MNTTPRGTQYIFSKIEYKLPININICAYLVQRERCNFEQKVLFRENHYFSRQMIYIYFRTKQTGKRPARGNNNSLPMYSHFHSPSKISLYREKVILSSRCCFQQFFQIHRTTLPWENPTQRANEPISSRVRESRVAIIRERFLELWKIRNECINVDVSPLLDDRDFRGKFNPHLPFPSSNRFKRSGENVRPYEPAERRLFQTLDFPLRASAHYASRRNYINIDDVRSRDNGREHLIPAIVQLRGLVVASACIAPEHESARARHETEQK